MNISIFDCDKEEQKKRIISNPELTFDKVLDNPDLVLNKVFCIFGNFEGLMTEGSAIRKLIYISEEKKWLISDLDLSDKFEESYSYHFKKQEIIEKFPVLLDLIGYVVDPIIFEQ